jgi:hypothetical protein
MTEASIGDIVNLYITCLPDGRSINAWKKGYVVRIERKDWLFVNFAHYTFSVHRSKCSRHNGAVADCDTGFNLPIMPSGIHLQYNN